MEGFAPLRTLTGQRRNEVSVETDFRRAITIINDYYWAQSRSEGRKADDRAREFLTEINAKYAVMLSLQADTAAESK